MNVFHLSLPFIKKEKIAADTYSFYFETRGNYFHFFPGQYIRITLPIQSPEKRSDSKFFTISSAPQNNEHIIVTTREGISEFKKELFLLKQNQKVQIFGPLGGFYLSQAPETDVVFLAGGIGITPFYSMLTHLKTQRLPRSITLIASFTNKEDILFFHELKECSLINPNIQSIFTLTGNDLSGEWHGETGRINEQMVKKYTAQLTAPHYYIVGPLSMVSQTEELLMSLGIPETHIKLELFTGY